MKVAEDGEPNFYRIITDDGRDWIAVVQINGEISVEAQRQIAAAIAGIFHEHVGLLTSQGRQ